jgi:hypothetical protein
MDFEKFSLSRQLVLLCFRGEFLMTTIYINKRVNLFKMDEKYYEMWYDASGNLVEKILEMKDRSLFQKYFEENGESFDAGEK